MKRPILVSLLVLCTAFVVACGDDDDSGSESETIAIAEWRTEADAICAEGDAEIESTAEELFGSEQPSREEIEEFATETIIPALQEQHDEISDLPAPDEQADTVETMLASLQEGIDELESDPSLVVQGNAAVQGIADAVKIARKVGLEDCGG